MLGKPHAAMTDQDNQFPAVRLRPAAPRWPPSNADGKASVLQRDCAGC